MENDTITIVTTTITSKCGGVNRAFAGEVSKELLGKLFAVYDEIDEYARLTNRKENINETNN